MPEPSGNACDGNACEEQQRGMGVSQTVNRDNRNPSVLAVSRQYAICGRVVHPAIDEDGLIVRQPLQNPSELHNELPIKLHLPNR